MRIISGKYSGRKIITPKGKETRPTTDRFKETLFNVIENSLKIDLKEKNILDLFAGSGSLGLEAMSRGAKSCVFVDKSSKAIKAIEDNVNNLGLLSSSSNCINIDVNKIRKFKKNVEDKIDIIFSDPPYSKTDINEIAIGNLVKNSWIRKNGYLFLETSSRRPIKDIKDFQIIDDRKIGDSLLITYLYSSY
ncbi:MAG: 16S rRNA (guanine(966)-N(2))-methyltransferase RsmD [Pseudomonadota bacterium]|jgi:16S rRNA (guanine966-N2)-methyltransferase|nr:16S rRNA (guanine(966)-N(2))-methyltransferase RsmD [Pseudomonadota bacterium]MED5483938.1 16S rRNA (guanine(966)-N(2))-methyltransferase RsmD [Pseudomonadota bacterium]|tara:strand:+ start:170 stop:742 length:573 start_codon:yes stop_codon:yes gene_type:complete